METVYICICIMIVVLLVIAITLYNKEGYNKEQRYKLIIPPNGILVSKTQSEYGSKMPNYTVDQAIEIYKRGVEVVNAYNKSDYKTWEESQLGVGFQDLITAIMFAPDKADELTKGLDTFNNNRVIAAANISSLETMHQPALWINNQDLMDALHEYQTTHESLLSE